MLIKFQVEFLEEAKEFLDSLDERTRKKILYNIWKSCNSNDKELFKKLNDNIWEFRTIYNRHLMENKKINNFDDLIELEHGKIGTESRNDYDERTQMFIVSEMLKEARRQANITQEELARRSGTKKAISQKLRMARAISSYLL